MVDLPWRIGFQLYLTHKIYLDADKHHMPENLQDVAQFIVNVEADPDIWIESHWNHFKKYLFTTMLISSYSNEIYNRYLEDSPVDVKVKLQHTYFLAELPRYPDCETLFNNSVYDFEPWFIYDVFKRLGTDMEIPDFLKESAFLQLLVTPTLRRYICDGAREEFIDRLSYEGCLYNTLCAKKQYKAR